MESRSIIQEAETALLQEGTGSGHLLQGNHLRRAEWQELEHDRANQPLLRRAKYKEVQAGGYHAQDFWVRD